MLTPPYLWEVVGPVIGATVRLVPRLFAIGCVSLFLFILVSYSRSPDFQRVSCSLVANDDAIDISVRLTQDRPDTFKTSGYVSVRKHPDLCRDNPCKVWLLPPLPPHPDGGGSPGTPITLRPSLLEPGLIYELENEFFEVHGNERVFPFDVYRIGTGALLTPASFHFPASGVSANTSITLYPGSMFTARQVFTWGEVVGFVDTTPLRSDQCGFVVERAQWYRAMVALLLLLLCSPLLYLLYKEDAAHPGLTLITSIIGVAAIRGFLLGNPTELSLHLIDFAFMSIIVLTAIVPVWRVGVANSNRRNAAVGEAAGDIPKRESRWGRRFSTRKSNRTRRVK